MIPCGQPQTRDGPTEACCVANCMRRAATFFPLYRNERSRQRSLQSVAADKVDGAIAFARQILGDYSPAGINYLLPNWANVFWIIRCYSRSQNGYCWHLGSKAGVVDGLIDPECKPANRRAVPMPQSQADVFREPQAFRRGITRSDNCNRWRGKDF